MTDANTFTSYIMGGQSRIVRCCQVLLEKGHRVLGVISDDHSVRQWCSEVKLNVSSPESCIETLTKTPFDVLFSIDNTNKVPDSVLALPRRYAINFHDGPLPRYAGTHATNWAIINGEKTHGITWHLMTAVIDAGDILKQTVFPLTGSETALTLNARCYEESVRLFAELVDDIANGSVQRLPQDLSLRTFFPLWKRPPAACVIDWRRPAEEISALVRALDVGAYNNPIGLPKILCPRGSVIATKISVIDTGPGEPPGTLVRVGDYYLQIATGSSDVSLSGFFSLRGEALPVPKLVELFDLEAGKRLPLVVNQRSERLSEVHTALARHEGYWVRRLAEAEPIDMPYARQTESSLGGALFLETGVDVPHEFVEAFHSGLLAGQIVLAAWAVYFFRTADRTRYDVLDGDVNLDRFMAGTEPFFERNVPLRVEVDPESPFADICERLGRQLESLARRGTYMSDLCARSPVLRDVVGRSRNTAFQVAFELGFSPEHVAGTEASDLSVLVSGDGRQCVLRYNSRVWDARTAERVAEQFRTLCADLAAHPQTPVSRANFIPEKERRSLLLEWNATQVDYPRGLCLHHLFEAQVDRTPDATALVCEKRSLTYRELNEKSNQLAHFLQKLGVGPDAMVGLFMERSLEMVVGIYGILKAGGAYVPLDPEYPAERLFFMIADTQVPVLLSQRHLLQHLPAHSAKTICIDSDWPLITAESDANPGCSALPENLAYVIYTSGSTGKPKGVMNEHRGIVNRQLWMQDQYRLNETDSVLQKTPFSFDVSVWEFFWPLLAGARLVVAKPGGHRDAAYLVEAIKQQGITTLHFVPSMLQLFLEEEGVGECKSLRRVICSGEALPLDLQNRFFERLDVELHNLYGPTEAAVDVTYWPCRQGSVQTTVPIGYPVANTRMHILDSRLQPVPIGAVGELHIGGIQVARGYLNRPELTAEKFIPDPFSSVPGDRLYKTGDVARYLPDGAIEYLGRTDFQVKLRGLRIELGEIESRITDYQGVKQCVVALREDSPGDKRLVAYIVIKPGIKVAFKDLRNFLQQQLPDYMVPQHFVQLNSIPLSSNGKADRKALPKPDLGGLRETTGPLPRSGTEKTVAEIWKDLLQVDSVGVNESFFDLGGNSLLIARMVRKLHEQLGVEVSIVDLFQYTTIASIGEFLSNRHAGSKALERTRNLAMQQINSLKRKKQVAAKRKGLQSG